MPISLGEVVLVSLFVECILYGFFVTMFSASVFIIIRRRNKTTGKLQMPMLLVVIVMFILATVHVGVDLQRVLEAYVYHPQDTKYLGRVNTVLYSIKSTAYCMQTLVGDGFMLYRLYMVWYGDKRVVIPIGLCFVASIGIGIGALQGFARASPSAPVFIKELHDWITSFFSLTLFTNFSSTLLIALRIWWVGRKAGNVTGTQSFMRAAIVIVESGAIYSACLVILLCLYLSASFAQYIVLDAVTQVVGIVFSMVIIRVAMGIANDSLSGHSVTRPTTKSKIVNTQSESYRMQPTLVHVSTTVTADKHNEGENELEKYTQTHV